MWGSNLFYTISIKLFNIVQIEDPEAMLGGGGGVDLYRREPEPVNLF